MPWVKFAIIAYLAVTLHTAFVPILFPESIRPNVFVIVTVYYLLTSRPSRSIIAASIIALLADLTSLCPLGSQLLAFTAFIAAIHALRPMIFTELPSAHAFTAFAGHIIVTSVYRIITLITTHADPLPYSMTETLLQAICTAIFAAILAQLTIRRPKRLKS